MMFHHKMTAALRNRPLALCFHDIYDSSEKMKQLEALLTFFHKLVKWKCVNVSKKKKGERKEARVGLRLPGS